MKRLFCTLIISGLFLWPHYAYAVGPVVINEFVAHPSAGNSEWVEFYVSDASSLSGFWIDDDTDFANDSGSSGKKSLEPLVQGSDSHFFVMELSSSLFNNDGDKVVLFNAEGVVIDQFEYSSDPQPDAAIGRTPDGSEGFTLLAAATKGSPNSGPQPTATPTPEPTAKPTAAPTQTPQPTIPKAKPLPTLPPISKTVASTQPTKVSYQTASKGAYPTAILGIKTIPKDKSVIPKPTQKVLVKSATNTAPAFLTILGGVFIMACAGLLYWRKWKNRI